MGILVGYELLLWLLLLGVVVEALSTLDVGSLVRKVRRLIEMRGVLGEHILVNYLRTSVHVGTLETSRTTGLWSCHATLPLVELMVWYSLGRVLLLGICWDEAL